MKPRQGDFEDELLSRVQEDLRPAHDGIATVTIQAVASSATPDSLTIVVDSMSTVANTGIRPRDRLRDIRLRDERSRWRRR